MIRLNVSRRVIIALICKLVVASFALAQQTIHVPMDAPTIQAGIDEAGNGDTILVSPGIYTENIDFKGKAVTVTSGAKSFSDPAVSATVISGAGNGPIAVFKTNETNGAVLNGFTIQNGTSTAVYLPGTSPVVSNNIITNNLGCGIVVTGSLAAPVITGNNISHTTAGVIRTDCKIPVVPFVGFASPGSGISVISGGNVQIIGNTIEANANQGTDCGAGIVAENVTTLLLENNVIRNNQSSCNAAIFARDISVLSVIQNLIYDNTVGGQGVSVSGSGAGLFVQKEPQFQTPTALTMINNTLYGNLTADSNPTSEGSQAIFTGTFTATTIENNLFISTDFVSPVDCVGTEGSTFTLTHNDLFNGLSQAVESNCVPDDAAMGNLSVDPRFINPSTNDFHTVPDSPIVAAGDLKAPGIPTADLDAKARTVDSTIDMGVYEIRPHPPIALTALPNPAPGQSTVTLAAVVTGNQKEPTGTITFLDGATVLGTAPLNGSGVATFSTSFLFVGTHNLTATYPGDFNFENSTSNTVTEVITGPPTTTVLNSVGPNPAKALQAVTMTATVSSAYAVPTGNVTFMAGGTVLTTVPVNANGTAAATVSTLAAGTYTITAVYGGSTQYGASTSNPVTENVIGVNTATSLSASSNSTPPGQTIIFTAQVSGAQSGIPLTGLVIFKDGATTIGTANVGTNGVATFGIATLLTGNHSVAATYNGAPNYNASVSGPVAIVITGIPTSVGLNASPNPAAVGQKVTLVATSVSSLPKKIPTGTVTFLDQGNVLGTATLSAGVAAFSTTALSAGTHQLTATLNPNGLFASSTSSSIAETVTDYKFSISISSTELHIPTGDHQTLAVTVTPGGGFPRSVSFGCISLPAHAQCSFTPVTSQPLSGGPQTVKLLLDTSDVLGYGQGVSNLTRLRLWSWDHYAPVLAAIFFPLLMSTGLGGLSLRSHPRLRCLLAIIALAGVGFGLAGCSGKLPGSTQPGTYVITVTATDSDPGSGLGESVNLTLNVTQ